MGFRVYRPYDFPDRIDPAIEKELRRLKVKFEKELHAATDGDDTDWHVKLTDVGPDGRSHKVTRGAAAAGPQWNESPQAQDPVALGLSIVKPCFSIVSTKSMVAPVRYGALILSVTTCTPSNTASISPSISRSSK